MDLDIFFNLANLYGICKLAIGVCLFIIVKSNNVGGTLIKLAELFCKNDGMIYKAAKAIWQQIIIPKINSSSKKRKKKKSKKEK